MTPQTSKTFFLILSLFIPVLFGIILPWPDLLPFPTWPCFFGLAFLCLAFSPNKVRDSLFMPIFKISHFIGTINQVLIMGIIFFTLFVPLAWIRRLFKIDSMRLKQSNQNSFWRKPDEPLINFDRPY